MSKTTHIISEEKDGYVIFVPKIAPSTKKMTLIASSSGWKNDSEQKAPNGNPLRINAMIGFYP